MEGDWTLDEFAEANSGDFGGTGRYDEVWEVFELIDFGIDNDGERDYYYIDI